jgi:hypothetical protein
MYLSLFESFLKPYVSLLFTESLMLKPSSNPASAPVFRQIISRLNTLLVTVFLAAFGAGAQAQTAAPAETVRNELVKPLQDARAAVLAKDYKAAIAALSAADSATNKTPFESFMIERLRLPAAAGVGDNATAAKSLEALLASGRLPTEDKPQFEANLFNIYVQQKDHRKVIALGQKMIGDNASNPARIAELRASLLPSAVALEDWALSASITDTNIADLDKSAKPIPESLLKLRASIALKQQDASAYTRQIERLVMLYPSSAYWQDLISRTLDAKTFAQRHIIDLLRLKLAVGVAMDADEYLDLAELAQRAGFPIEAERAIKAGLAAGILGAGKDAAKHTALRDKFAKEAAEDRKTLDQATKNASATKDGPALFNTGYNLAISGATEAGITMMEEGLKRPGLRNTEDLRLRLGATYAITAQKARALSLLKDVKGADGITGLAQLWSVYAQRTLQATVAPITPPGKP